MPVAVGCWYRLVAQHRQQDVLVMIAAELKLESLNITAHAASHHSCLKETLSLWLPRYAYCEVSVQRRFQQKEVVNLLFFTSTNY